MTGPVVPPPGGHPQGQAEVNPAQGWTVASKQLKLDGDTVGSPVKIDGEKLKAGSKHVLKGKAVFRRGGDNVTVTESLSFEAC